MAQLRVATTMVSALAAATLLCFGSGTWWFSAKARERTEDEQAAASKLQEEELREENVRRLHLQGQQGIQGKARTSLLEWWRSDMDFPIHLGKDATANVLRLRKLPKRKAPEESPPIPEGRADRPGD